MKLIHLPTRQQYERLEPQPPLCPPRLIPPQLRRLRHARIRRPQAPPVARLRSRSEVALAERSDRIVRDALRLGRVREQARHRVREVGEVALDFDVVLRGAVGAEQVVVVLDVLQFVGDDDGAAGLAVFEGGGVGTAWRGVVSGC